jgi:hypothetical protein
MPGILPDETIRRRRKIFLFLATKMPFEPGNHEGHGALSSYCDLWAFVDLNAGICFQPVNHHETLV